MSLGKVANSYMTVKPRFFPGEISENSSLTLINLLACDLFKLTFSSHLPNSPCAIHLNDNFLQFASL